MTLGLFWCPIDPGLKTCSVTFSVRGLTTLHFLLSSQVEPLPRFNHSWTCPPGLQFLKPNSWRPSCVLQHVDSAGDIKVVNKCKMNDWLYVLPPLCLPPWNTYVRTQENIINKKNNQVLFLWKMYRNRYNTL